jgi:quinol monooxygenase YgiN
VSLHGTEISFRLGPGTLGEARALAVRLAEASAGARRHVLFAAPEAGEYGCLAEWDDPAAAAAFAGRPAVRAVLAELAERLGSAPRVRLYAMEEQTPGAP